MKEGIIKRIEISEEEKIQILEYSANMCKLAILRKKNLITDKEYEEIKEKLKKPNNYAE